MLSRFAAVLAGALAALISATAALTLRRAAPADGVAGRTTDAAAFDSGVVRFTFDIAALAARVAVTPNSGAAADQQDLSASAERKSKTFSKWDTVCPIPSGKLVRLMNLLTIKFQETMIRAADLVRLEPALQSPASLEAATDITRWITRIDSLRIEQAAGAGGKSGAVCEQKVIAAELRRALRDITQTARVLSRKLRPGLADELHFPLQRTQAALLAAGESFVSVIQSEGLESVFIERGFPEDFLAELTGLVAKFRAATERKFGGLGVQIGSTAALAQAVREGMAAVRDLDAMLSPKLRRTNPAFYDRWKSAIKIGHPPRRKKNASTKIQKAPADTQPPADPMTPPPQAPTSPTLPRPVIPLPTHLPPLLPPDGVDRHLPLVGLFHLEKIDGREEPTEFGEAEIPRIEGALIRQV